MHTNAGKSVDTRWPWTSIEVEKVANGFICWSSGPLTKEQSFQPKACSNRRLLPWVNVKLYTPGNLDANSEIQRKVNRKPWWTRISEHWRREFARVDESFSELQAHLENFGTCPSCSWSASSGDFKTHQTRTSILQLKRPAFQVGSGWSNFRVSSLFAGENLLLQRHAKCDLGAPWLASLTHGVLTDKNHWCHCLLPRTDNNVVCAAPSSMTGQKKRLDWQTIPKW